MCLKIWCICFWLQPNTRVYSSQALRLVCRYHITLTHFFPVRPKTLASPSTSQAIDRSPLPLPSPSPSPQETQVRYTILSFSIVRSPLSSHFSSIPITFTASCEIARFILIETGSFTDLLTFPLHFVSISLLIWN